MVRAQGESIPCGRVTQLSAQVGTAVVTRQDKRLALGRLGSLVEQIEALVSKDRQVILVRSPHLIPVQQAVW